MSIYFSRHGSASYAPPIMEPIYSPDPEDTVSDISDCGINVFLGERRDAKGPSITLILDCCHSGGMTRGGLVPRFVDPLPLADMDFRRRPASERTYTEF